MKNITYELLEKFTFYIDVTFFQIGGPSWSLGQVVAHLDQLGKTWQQKAAGGGGGRRCRQENQVFTQI